MNKENDDSFPLKEKETDIFSRISTNTLDENSSSNEGYKNVDLSALICKWDTANYEAVKAEEEYKELLAAYKATCCSAKACKGRKKKLEDAQKLSEQKNLHAINIEKELESIKQNLTKKSNFSSEKLN